MFVLKWRLLSTVVYGAYHTRNHSGRIYSLTYLSCLLSIQNPNQRQPGDIKTVKRGTAEEDYAEPSLLCVCGCWSSRLTVREEGFLWGCSLFWMAQLFPAHSRVPVPTEQPGSAKKKDRHSLTPMRTVTKPTFMRVSFRGDQQAPGKLGRPYAVTRTEHLLLHQSISRGHSPPPFNLTTGSVWPGTARLRVASGPPGTCWWAWCPSLDALLADSYMWVCWQSIEGEPKGAM